MTISLEPCLKYGQTEYNASTSQQAFYNGAGIELVELDAMRLHCDLASNIAASLLLVLLLSKPSATSDNQITTGLSTVVVDIRSSSSSSIERVIGKTVVGK